MMVDHVHNFQIMYKDETGKVMSEGRWVCASVLSSVLTYL